MCIRDSQQHHSHTVLIIPEKTSISIPCNTIFGMSDRFDPMKQKKKIPDLVFPQGRGSSPAETRRLGCRGCSEDQNMWS
eukprot:358623-Prorocentrum_lima.AAC.1